MKQCKSYARMVCTGSHATVELTIQALSKAHVAFCAASVIKHQLTDQPSGLAEVGYSTFQMLYHATVISNICHFETNLQTRYVTLFTLVIVEMSPSGIARL